jgi:hypothetical protein
MDIYDVLFKKLIIYILNLAQKTFLSKKPIFYVVAPLN